MARTVERCMVCQEIWRPAMQVSFSMARTLLDLFFLKTNFAIHSSSGFDSDACRIVGQRSRPLCSSQPSGAQKNSYDFTGCLAHAELTEHVSNGQVSHIIGFFNHDSGCSGAVMARIPSIPLHPHVCEVVLQQLHSSARCVSFSLLPAIFTHHIIGSVAAMQ